MRAPDFDQLPAIAGAALDAVWPGGDRSQCVTATYIAIEVLDHFGAAARPYPCILTAVHGTTAVVLGPGAVAETSRATYSGHLVAVVPALEAMLDLTLAQLNRRYGLSVPDAAWFAWPADMPPDQVPYYTVNGVTLNYAPHPDPRAYLRHDISPSRLVRLMRPTIGNIIRALRDQAPKHQHAARRDHRLLDQLLAARARDA